MTLLLRGFYFNWALLDTLALLKTKAFLQNYNSQIKTMLQIFTLLKNYNF